MSGVETTRLQTSIWLLRELGSYFLIHLCVYSSEAGKKNNYLALLGLEQSFFQFSRMIKELPFQVRILLPVLGVVLLVLYAEKETLVARFLSVKVFVSIGLISYSAYLWHQPVFAF